MTGNLTLARLASLIMIAGLGAPEVSAARLSMTIRILDQADLPVSKLEKLERYVENAVAALQVDVKWIDCAANVTLCQNRRSSNEFWLRILAQMPPNANAGIDLLGFTQRGETGAEGIQCVNVFYPMVEQLSRLVSADSHQILGAAVVHEIGHLYLGTNNQAHSATGIMCGVWSRREIELVSIGELHFTREQSVRIRAAMTAAAAL
jgi:hypothetical protein